MKHIKHEYAYNMKTATICSTKLRHGLHNITSPHEGPLACQFHSTYHVWMISICFNVRFEVFTAVKFQVLLGCDPV